MSMMRMENQERESRGEERPSKAQGEQESMELSKVEDYPIKPLDER